MRVAHFDYDLPPGCIALRPARPRDAARLLVVRPGTDKLLEDRGVRDLPDLLRPGDALVFNDTRVIRAELKGTRWREDAAPVPVGVTLHKRLDESRWRAFARPARRLKPGDRLTFGHEGRVCLLGTLTAHVEDRADEEATLAFAFHGPMLDEAIATLGDMPLPPYIAARRAADETDVTDYQTLYAREDGAVAAPTAGLHFTPALFAALEARGLARRFVTLHVGGGTFLPVRGEDTGSHRMHSEWGEASAATAEALNATRAAGGRIVAVGTTALRLLESAAGDDGTIRPFRGDTDLFITPGYRFKAVDVLMTNFHLPRSTLLMLVAAFSGLETVKRAYAHAVSAGYRFYSYGDACLLHPQGTEG